MNLCEYYNCLVADNTINYDNAQFSVLHKLDIIKSELEVNNSGLLNKLKKILNLHKHGNTLKSTNGCYIYSTVGRGKTMIMDLFYNKLSLEPEEKHRTHFHLFMKTIHRELQQAGGIKEPIEYIIKAHYKHYKVICLDEFMVHDIADAMILAKVIEYMVKHGIILVATSNVKPDDLYENGLQRASFLPAIKLINSCFTVFLLEGIHDYRKSMLSSEQYFISNSDNDAVSKFNQLYLKLSNSNLESFAIDNESNQQIDVAGRKIKVNAVHDYAVWFDFNIICNSPRSSHDYIEISEVYKFVFISNLFEMDDSHLELVRRFINLIDILYDYKVMLFVTSSAGIDDIYIGNALEFEIKRTISRLKEMQSLGYMSEIHI